MKVVDRTLSGETLPSQPGVPEALVLAAGVRWKRVSMPCGAFCLATRPGLISADCTYESAQCCSDEHPLTVTGRKVFEQHISVHESTSRAFWCVLYNLSCTCTVLTC